MQLPKLIEDMDFATYLGDPMPDPTAGRGDDLFL